MLLEAVVEEGGGGRKCSSNNNEEINQYFRPTLSLFGQPIGGPCGGECVCV